MRKSDVDAIRKRAESLEDWLREHAPECDSEQRHLDADTPERAYWHYGYTVALRDVLALLKGNASTLVH